MWITMDSILIFFVMNVNEMKKKDREKICLIFEEHINISTLNNVRDPESKSVAFVMFWFHFFFLWQTLCAAVYIYFISLPPDGVLLAFFYFARKKYWISRLSHGIWRSVWIFSLPLFSSSYEMNILITWNHDKSHCNGRVVQIQTTIEKWEAN